MKKIILSAAAFSLFSFSARALEPSQAMGQGLFEQKGSNSCSFCHGITGVGGSVKNAAHLNEPKSWKVWKALGGDAAFAKNKADFLKKMEEATTALITKGSIIHNATFKQPWFDWKKISPYDGQMMGLNGAASAAWLKKYADRGVSKDVAAKAAYLHIQTLDKQGVFK
jgi:hypothetical protein